MAAKKKKISKPLMEGQKVYVLGWDGIFVYAEGTLKYKGPSKLVVEFTSGDNVFEECYKPHNVVEKCPANRKILTKMQLLSNKTNQDLIRLRDSLLQG